MTNHQFDLDLELYKDIPSYVVGSNKKLFLIFVSNKLN